jgi:protein-export membrane protein SecD
MLQVARWRLIVVALATILGILFAAPSVLPANLRNQLPPFLRETTINLGLDLRGGTQLLMQIDTQAMLRQRLDNVADQMRGALRDAEPRIRVTGAGVAGNVARVRLADPADATRAMSVLEGIITPVQTGGLTGDPDLRFTLREGGVIDAQVTQVSLNQLARQAVNQSIEVIRRRVDPSGVGEISIQPEGGERIVVQAPGESDPNALRRRIGRTALMTFHLLREDANVAEAAQGRVPAGAIFVPFAASAGQEGGLVLERRPRLTGKDLTNAQAGFDQLYNRPVVNFEFDGRGAKIFCRISTDNVDKQFAIVLDDRILTAPVINEPICGGRGQISGNFTPQETQELSLLLRAGSLPVPLTVLQQQTITAELGQDAIEAGQTSTLLAFGLVLIFMVLAYGLLFGGISVIALVLNGILIMAAMAIGGAALTLPGVAGLILTLAVALDANVLIYERMRDEVRAGRSPVLAAESGFNRAFVTIIDANATHLGAAAIMFFLGAGPIKGFAWTLFIGVFTSVFTAVLVTQILIAWWFRSTRPKRLPVS